MTTAIRKLTTRRPKVLDKRQLALERRDTRYRMRDAGVSEAVGDHWLDPEMLWLMNEFETLAAPILRRGNWHEFGKLVIDRCRENLKEGYEPPANLLATCDPLPYTEQGYQSSLIVARRVAMRIRWGEFRRAMESAFRGYEDIRDDLRHELTVRAWTPICHSGLHDETQSKLTNYGITTIGDLLQWSPNELRLTYRLDRSDMARILTRLAELGLRMKPDPVVVKPT